MKPKPIKNSEFRIQNSEFQISALPLAAALFSLCTLMGCVNQGSSYASKHPELSQAHRQILVSGKVPSGDAVAGMTREQVKMAMGGGPATLDKIDGPDAWGFAHKKTVARAARADADHTPRSSI